MHFSRLVTPLVSGLLATVAIAACSSSNGSDAGPAGEDSGPAEGGAQDSGVGVDSSGLPDGNVDGAFDSAADGPHDAPDGDGPVADAGPDADASVDADADAADPGVPGILYIGRFDTSDVVGPTTAWPGASIVARFDGTNATVKLTQVDGFNGGPSWFNVVVDGTDRTPFSVTAGTHSTVVASGLAAGVHTIELQKRTEANLGAVRFEGFTFGGGAGLLSPPARVPRRIEFLSDSTIDGFGVEGDVNVTCGGGAPPQYGNARKSLSFYTSSALGAEMMLLAYSGKGLTKNEWAGDPDKYPLLYGRTLPDTNGSTWDFATNVPDVVVISVGGTDLDGLGPPAPAAFSTAYNTLVGTVRGHYPNAHIFATVWSQIKDYAPPDTRTAMRTALQTIVNARVLAGDTKLWFFQFPEADFNVDETGCYYHANAAHHQAMAALLVPEIKLRTGWL